MTVGFPGLTVSDVSLNSSGLLHTIKLQHFHQVAIMISSAHARVSVSVPAGSLNFEHVCVFRSIRLSELLLQASAK